MKKKKKIGKLKKKSNFEKKTKKMEKLVKKKKKVESTVDYCCNPQCFVWGGTVIQKINKYNFKK